MLEEKGFTDISIISLRSKIKKVKTELEIQALERKLSAGVSFVSIKDIDKLSGYGFENFLKSLFEKMGYKVEQTKSSKDQGADLVVSKLGEKIVVQAKRYSGKVGNKAIQEITAAIKHYEADRGMVVTNSEFTRSAMELAKSNNIELIDRYKLEKLINRFW